MCEAPFGVIPCASVVYFFIKMKGLINIAKKGMRRPSPKEPHGTESNKKNKYPKDTVEPVPELQGKAKLSNKKAMNKSFKREDFIMNRKG